MSAKPKWIDQIKQQSAQFRNAPQIQAFEQATTTCLEIVMSEINMRIATLYQEGVHEIDMTDTLNLHDPRTGRPTQIGLYHTVQFLAGDTVLSHGAINGKRFTRDTIEKLGSLMHIFSPEEHQMAIERFFYRHSQLAKIPELDTPEKLFQFIDTIVTEETQNWLLGKPSRLNPKPQGPQIP